MKIDKVFDKDLILIPENEKEKELLMEYNNTQCNCSYTRLGLVIIKPIEQQFKEVMNKHLYFRKDDNKDHPKMKFSGDWIDKIE